MIQNDTLSKLATGSLGFAGAEIAPDVVSIVTADPSNVVQIIVQIIIGIATLVGLFKKKN